MAYARHYGNCWSDSFQNQTSFVKKIAIGLAIGVTAHLTFKCISAHLKKKRRSSYKQGVVILHQFDRGTTSPNLSPYCLKLETYLRMAKIPYENSFDDALDGPTGKAPWITYNGKDITDSTSCIEFLNNEFHVDLDAHLNEEQKALGLILRNMAEYHFVKCWAMHRWVFDDKEKSVGKIAKWPSFPPFFMLWGFISKTFKNDAFRALSQETVEKFGKDDMKALSINLGNKPYFLGAKPSEVDLALFATLANCVWNLPNSPYETWINDEFVNLREFCFRMKEQFWPDWDSVLITL